MAMPAAAQTTITIERDSEIGTIQPEVYGQFLEHLGTQLYGGLWVGEDSDIPNTDGIRDDVFAALQKLKVPVIRWPGGCYADLYHWRDGVGERTPRVNLAWGGTAEPNTFGTHEFFNLAERLGAKTYLNVNLGSGTVNEAADWLEYITGNGQTALAQERRANGRTAPWKIDYLSIGNETWGCGGRMRPAYYADLYAHWASFMTVDGEKPVMIVAGAHDGNPEFSDEVLDHPMIGEVSKGISLHYYTLPTSDWSRKGAATGFPESEWASTLERTLRMDGLIASSIAMIDSHEKLPDDYGLYIDEWGTWFDETKGRSSLWQENTIRDGVVAALNLNIFHKYADRVPMTNIAQMVNVLQAMILVDGERMTLTPTYHVFEMYVPFQNAQSLRVAMDSPTYSNGKISVPALSASAGRMKDGRLAIALVNADPAAAHAIAIPRKAGERAAGRILSGDAMDSRNTATAPDAVAPRQATIRQDGNRFTAVLPARSVSVWIVG
ncbi:alpha-L-arabinofuranosidase C-terminal domain-containing protein [Porphyrobacter sp. YT40]|uniref:alpha-N-arabinofuranosidase n=1 Tax=Porphyrobacter sp. YT40 TaxID=2547601 RepID=UPI0015E8E997|nr:alpha-L-arabinofuranosidase C-terminal domain-containing protein [Porphyrobacter sp. YT40]